MPLLTRMVGTPLTIDIGPGAVEGLAPLLADRRISRGGHVAVVVGPGLGEEIAAMLRPQLGNGEIWDVAGGSSAGRRRARGAPTLGFYDAVVGIGGGRTLDVAKYAASLSGLPVVAVATSLAHDGIASPVASLDDEQRRKSSYGVQMPIAVVVDLDYVRRSEPAMRRSGIGDAISNLSAIADWRLAERERGEAVDGVAVTFARIGGHVDRAPRGRDRGRRLPDRARRGARAVGPRDGHGRVEPPVQRRRPRDPARDRRTVPRHRAPRRAGGRGEPLHVVPAWRRRPGGGLDACLRRHGLPRTPADLGLSDEQFAQAVVRAPDTRPDRFTILEHLALDEAGARRAVAEFVDAHGR